MTQLVQKAGSWVAVAAVLSMASALVACGDDKGGIQGGKVPRLEVSEGSRPVVVNGTVAVSATGQTTIRVANRGTGSLQIKAITLTSEYQGAFEILSLPMPSEASPVTIAPGGLDHEFAIVFNASAVPEGARPRATVSITTNRTIDDFDVFTFYAAPDAASAKLLLQPPVLDFGLVQDATSSTKPLSVLNSGAATLTISKVYFSGHLGYKMRAGGVEYGVTAESSSAGIVLDPALTLAPGTTQQVDVTYTAAGAEAAQGSIIFVSNDPSAPNGTEAKLFANLEGPCVRVNPSRVDFGGKLVGQLSEIMLEIESCGDVDLIVSNVDVVEDPAGVFDIDKSRVGTLPLTIAPSQKVQVPVTYFPSALATLGADGQFSRDLGLLRIQSNAYLANFDVDLTGFGTDGSCPTAVINVAQGDEVLPQTVLQLDASGSTASQGAVTAWEWSVVAPQGSTTGLLPSKYVRNPTFEANIIGTYTFRLKVFDALGTVSCSEAEYVVNVTSDDAIHVELLWNTPGDPDQSDTGGAAGFSAGSDVDLHFLHPRANGQYFDWTYDCNWESPTQEWGFFGPSDNPRLDRDDTDGAGPENLNVAVPEQNVRFQVGSHYWNDWSYGFSLATVRVYIYGILRDQWSDVRIVNGDMWDSHYIDWPSGVVTRITGAGGGPRITAQYPVNSGLPF